jgi:hypothetical protein
MSPLPTPLDRQDVDCRWAHVRPGGMNAPGHVGWQQGTGGSAQLDRGVRDDLRKARIKTATGNLTRALSPACELGKACTDTKGVCSPDDVQAGGASVVV